MTLPEKIILSASCDDLTDLSGLIFVMTVYSATKNPYSISFPKTSPEGVAEISAADFRGQSEDHHEQALMDHAGSIESASQWVKLGLLDTASFKEHRAAIAAWPLTTHERCRWSSRQEYVDYILSCRNDSFVLARRRDWHEIPAHRQMEVKLKPRLPQ